jgi:hypothetical protein
MSRWDRGDAEMAIALKRVELNAALAHKTNYDAEGHNICLALIAYTDNTTEVLAAYSNDSVLRPSMRLGLGLVSDVAGTMPKSQRMNCDGMAQYHTEPKLLNYLCATPRRRQSVLKTPLPKNPIYRKILKAQRDEAMRRPSFLKTADDIVELTLVTEIDCCVTCTRYAVDRFRTRFPETPLDVIELHKVVSAKKPPQYEEVTIKKRK